MIPIEPRETFTHEQLVALLEQAAEYLDRMTDGQDMASACYQAADIIKPVTP